MVKAIGVTLTRVIITKKNLLEWVTSADVEKSQKNSRASYVKMMRAALFASPTILILAIAFRPEAILIGLLFAILWGCSPLIAYWVSKEQKDAVPYTFLLSS